MNSYDRESEAVEMSHRKEAEMAHGMYERNASLGINIKAGIAPPSKEETIEELAAQVLKNSFELMDASGALRINMLGPWPETVNNEKNANYEAQGLVPILRKTLYTILRNQQETRTHIAMISGGVR